MRAFNVAIAVSALLVSGGVAQAQKGGSTKTQVSQRGKITIVNDTTSSIAVTLGEESLGEVPAHGRRDFDRIITGSRLFTAQTAEKHRRWGPREVFVREEGGEWKVSEAATTGIKVINYGKDTLNIDIDGKPGGRAVAGGDAVFMELKTGMVKIAATSASGKLSYSPRFIEVKEGALAEWKIGTPPAAPADAEKKDEKKDPEAK